MTAARSRLLGLPLLAAVLLLTWLPRSGEARPGATAPPPRGDLLIPGGVAGLYRAVNLPPPRDRAYALLTLARLLYPEVEGVNPDRDARALRLRRYIDVLGQWCIHLAPFGGRVSLEGSGEKVGRDRLKSLVGFVGMDLVETRGVCRVRRNGDREGASRRELLAVAGVALDGLDDKLNAGGVVDLTAPGETVPLPLAQSTWRRVIFEEQVPAEALFAFVVGYREALWLYCGLTALDDETLVFLEATPNLLAWLYGGRAAVFASFGPSVRVRRGRVETPGGARDSRLWESLVGSKTTDAAQFVQRLLTRDQGRLAWFYDTVAGLDTDRQSAAMASDVADPSAREAAFRDLYARFEGFRPSWDASVHPFTRLPIDPSLASSVIDVAPSGFAWGPTWKAFWEVAFETGDLPSRAPESFQALERSRPVALSWMLARVFRGSPADERARLDLVLFAGRVFRSIDAAHAFDALVALRGFGRFPALMLVLERIGVLEPAVYAAAARAAEAASGPADATTVTVRIVAFQGAVALLDRLHEVHALDSATATRLARSLFAIRATLTGWYSGGIARWIDGEVLPAVGGAAGPGEAEARMITALAGVRAAPDHPRPVIEWEGQRYHVDVARGLLGRLLQVREKQGGPDLDTVLALWRTATTVGARTSATGALAAGQAALKSASGSLGPVPGSTLLGPEPPDAARIVPRALEVLAGVRKAGEIETQAEVVESLIRLADRAAAEWLASIAYAVRIEDVNASVLLGGNPALRHDLRIMGRYSGDSEPLSWSVPTPQYRAGTGMCLEGSLLGLGLPLARFAVTRWSAGPPPHPPTLHENDSAIFMASLALFNPFEVTDGERDVIAAAGHRGRARVEALATDASGWASVAAELSADGWQRQLLPWMIANEPERLVGRFSAYDLFVLGGGEKAGGVERWGMLARPLDGSLSVRLPPRRIREALAGRSYAGILATQLPDLNFRVAEFLADARLPAALARGVLGVALPEFLANALLDHDGDWPGLVAQARAIKKEQLEGYMSALIADGPLVPVAGVSGAVGAVSALTVSPRRCP